MSLAIFIRSALCIWAPFIVFSSLSHARLQERAVGGGTPGDLRRAALTPLWPFQSFVTEPDFHPPILEITKQSSATDALFVYAPLPFTPVYPNRFFGGLISDTSGNPVYHTSTLPMGQFHVQQLNGKPVLTFWSGGIGGNFVDAHGIGAITIMDNTYKIIKNVTLNDGTFKAGDNMKNVPYPSYVDIHESYITARNTMIVTAYNSTPLDLTSVGGPRDGWVLDSLIYEFDLDRNKTVFRWSSVEHLDELPLNGSHQLNPDGSIIDGNNATFPWDYFLTNAVAPLDDGYVISCRHYWSAIALDAKGNVKWNLNGKTGGDFKPVDQSAAPSTFSWQHYVRPVEGIPNKSLTLDLFNNNNNGNDNGSAPSTALSLHLDLQKRTVQTLSALHDPKESLYADSQGSYDRLPRGHKFVGYGQIPVLKEYDQNDRVVMNARFGVDNQVSSYRSFLVSDWSATPYWDPKIAATREQNGSTVLSMSWNGATPDVYDSWEVYSSPNSTFAYPPTSKVPRTGFETNVTLVPGTKVVLAVAAKGLDKVRTSANLTLV
ncbi:MAG: hypothetical protein Q9220_001586 [cf. Caloplaca sp. 1 TL-2023]